MIVWERLYKRVPGGNRSRRRVEKGQGKGSTTVKREGFEGLRISFGRLTQEDLFPGSRP